MSLPDIRHNLILTSVKQFFVETAVPSALRPRPSGVLTLKMPRTSDPHCRQCLPPQVRACKHDCAAYRTNAACASLSEIMITCRFLPRPVERRKTTTDGLSRDAHVLGASVMGIFSHIYNRRCVPSASIQSALASATTPYTRLRHSLNACRVIYHQNLFRQGFSPA